MTKTKDTMPEQEEEVPVSENPIDPATGCPHKSGEVPLGKNEPCP